MDLFNEYLITEFTKEEKEAFRKIESIKLYDKDNNLLASDDIIVKTTLTDNLLFIIKNIPEFFKSVVLMIGEIPYLLALAFSIGGLFF